MSPKTKCKNPTQRILNGLRRRKCSCGAELHSWSIERDQIETTYGGMIGGKPDYMRKFMSGPIYLTFECVRGHKWSEPFPKES